MAETWRATVQDLAYAGMRSMVDLIQASGGGRVIKVRRIFQFNSQKANQLIPVTAMMVRSITEASGGTAVTPQSHDSANTPLVAQVTSGKERTTTFGGEVHRLYSISLANIAAGGPGFRDWCATVPGALVWDLGYRDPSLLPITLREVEGVELYHHSVVAAAQTDTEIEFTDEAP